MRIDKILAGIDFEKDTDSVLAYASFFAKSFSASLTLFHVIDYLMTPPSYLVPYIEEEKREAGKKLETLKRQLADTGLNAGTEVVIGRLRESFELAAKRITPGLIVLGFVSHAFRLSSSEKLIKGLQMPMLVVRGDRTESAHAGPVKIGKILCPTDFSEISGRALSAAKGLADKFAAQLDVLNVFPGHMLTKLGTREAGEKALKELYGKAKNNLDGFLRASGLEGLGAVEGGEPDRRIVSYSKEKDIDLIVMGARGLGLIRGMLIGSVTDAVLRSSPCPVLVIH